MTQLQFALLDPAPMARHSDPDTSHEAAAQAKALQARHHRLIIDCLQAHGPMGKDGIAARTALTGVAVARRLPELERTGQAKPTGRRVSSTTGRSEREWVAC